MDKDVAAATANPPSYAGKPDKEKEKAAPAKGKK
jgi:hypothetical protein